MPTPQQKSSPQWQLRPELHLEQLTVCPQLFVRSMPQPFTPLHVTVEDSGTQFGTQVPLWQVELASHVPQLTAWPQLFVAPPQVAPPHVTASDWGAQTQELPLHVVPAPHEPQLTD